jgi:hypothetical protein
MVLLLLRFVLLVLEIHSDPQLTFFTMRVFKAELGVTLYGCYSTFGLWR